MSAIGILGGMGPQASARLYELLIQGTKAYTPAAVDSDFPEIVIFSVPVPNFVSDKKQLKEVKRLLLKRIILLEQADCTVNGIACNTAHILLPDLQAVTKVPFLAIPDLVEQKIKESGFKRVGLLATPQTLGSKLYPDLIRPSQVVKSKISKLIYKQLNSSITQKDTQDLRQIVEKFLVDESLDAVVLGCTELPLIFGESEENVIDTLQLLADGLLEAYYTSLV